MDTDILVGAILGFHIGNDVQNMTTRKYKRCPISGQDSMTICGSLLGDSRTNPTLLGISF